VVSLCRELGARVVAEGIETEDELSAVIDTGAQYGQAIYWRARRSDPRCELAGRRQLATR